MNHLSFLSEMIRLLWSEMLVGNLLTDRQAQGIIKQQDLASTAAVGAGGCGEPVQRRVTPGGVWIVRV